MSNPLGGLMSASMPLGASLSDPGGVPAIRVFSSEAPVRPERDFVLHWMVASRRTRANPTLERSLAWARALGKPLLVLEPLRVAYPHASDRFHRFVVEGMADQARAFAAAGITYHPWVERTEGEGSGLLESLAARACVVVTDDYPCFFIPRMQAAAEQRLDVLLERVDGNGLLPRAAADRAHGTAHSLRRFLQKELPPHLEERAALSPLDARPDLPPAQIPPEVLSRWPALSREELADPAWIGELPIDHAVGPVELRGGQQAALAHMETFLAERFPRYADSRNHPEDPVTSGLSPWLHFGHLSSTELFERIVTLEDWNPGFLGSKTDGSRRGWWGMSEAAEGFLDQLITWRELGFNLCSLVEDYDQYCTLPEWARRTLDEHRADEREHCYSLEEFEEGRTHDPLWNAAQHQLREHGMIHNYLRMLWGKKVLHWSASPEEAYATLLHLNNKYALDGRDPNSYCAISWIFGRFDRAWGPERPVFGKIRYMSSENTARKVRVRGYIREHSG